MDTKLRSGVKSIIWRTIAIIVLATVSYLVTGSLKQMTAITIIFNCIQVMVYYTHERIWGRIAWGKIKHPLADIPVKEKIAPEDLEVIQEKLKSLGYLS